MSALLLLCYCSLSFAMSNTSSMLEKHSLAESLAKNGIMFLAPSVELLFCA